MLYNLEDLQECSVKMLEILLSTAKSDRKIYIENNNRTQEQLEIENINVINGLIEQKEKGLL